MYISFLSFRYLRRRISAVGALLAVTFGVATLFTVLSVMEGYRVKLRELVRGLESHLTLVGIPGLSLEGADELEEEISRVVHVAATAPFAETIAMYTSLGRLNYFHLKGIDPVKEARVGALTKYLLRAEEVDRLLPVDQPVPSRPVLDEKVHSLFGDERKPLSEDEVQRLFSRERRQEVLRRTSPGRPLEAGGSLPGGLVVGINLLLDRQVFLGDQVKVITLSPDDGKPLSESFVVVGAFKSGDSETDGRTALVRLERLQSFMRLFDPATGEPREEGIRIALDDYRHAAAVRPAILRALAEATAGSRLPPLLQMMAETGRSIAAEPLEGIVEEVRRNWPGGEEFSKEEIGKAVRAAADLFATPEVAAAGTHRAEEAYPRELKGFLEVNPSFVSDKHILRGVVDAAGRGWQERLLGKLKPAGRPNRDELLELVARSEVLREAIRRLEAGLDRLIPHPLIAEVSTWEARQQVLLAAVGQEKYIVGFLVLLINLFTGCLVLLMLVLVVIEKTRDTGVLLALGATTRGVVGIFLRGGLFVVGAGVALGLGLGWLFVTNINSLHDAVFAATGYKLFDPETYRLDQLPTTISMSEVLFSVLPSVLFGLLASLLPAVWAARKDPIKAIHYE